MYIWEKESIYLLPVGILFLILIPPKSRFQKKKKKF